MSGTKINLGKGYVLSKDGKVVKKPYHASVSEKIRQRKSKRTKVVKRSTPT